MTSTPVVCGLKGLTRFDMLLDGPQDGPAYALYGHLLVVARVLAHRHAPVLVRAQQAQARAPRGVRVRDGREVHGHDDPEGVADLASVERGGRRLAGFPDGGV